MAQANFEPTFSYIYTLTILKPSHYFSSYPPAHEDGTECSETSTYKIQMPGNYPEENNIQHSQHGEHLKSSAQKTFTVMTVRYLYFHTHPVVLCS
jgi:hypothetical protein